MDLICSILRVQIPAPPFETLVFTLKSKHVPRGTSGASDSAKWRGVSDIVRKAFGWRAGWQVRRRLQQYRQDDWESRYRELEAKIRKH